MQFLLQIFIIFVNINIITECTHFITSKNMCKKGGRGLLCPQYWFKKLFEGIF